MVIAVRPEDDPGGEPAGEGGHRKDGEHPDEHGEHWDQREYRRAKIEAIRERGGNPYPFRYPVDHSAADSAPRTATCRRTPAPPTGCGSRAGSC